MTIIRYLILMRSWLFNLIHSRHISTPAYNSLMLAALSSIKPTAQILGVLLRPYISTNWVFIASIEISGLASIYS